MPLDGALAGAIAGPLVDHVRVTADPPGLAWEEYVRGHPDASLFHGLPWQHAIARTFPSFEPRHLTGWRDGRVVGVLPLFLVPGFPGGHSLISTPLGVYGGVLADDDEAAQAILDHSFALAIRIGAHYVELRHRRAVGDLPMKDLYVTFLGELKPTREANLAAIAGNRRRRIRAAEEQYGLRGRSGGPELLPEFYAIYARNMRNLGSPPFPLRLFRNLLEEYGPQCRIFGVFQGETMTSGSFTFFHRDRIMPYYSASTPEGMTVATNEYMYWYIISYGAEHGFKLFDFGRSKKESGSYHFKRLWGFPAKPLPYQYQLVTYQGIPNLSPSNPRFAPLIWTWQRMPVSFTTWLGPKLSRFFP